MKYLVIGHKGLIGTELTKHFEENKIEYFGVDRFQVFPKNKSFDCVIHMASNCIIRDVIKNPNLANANMNINFKALEYCRENKIKKFVYFSSSRVMHTEANPYIASKIQGEVLCKSYELCYGVESLIIRPETIWGMQDKHNRVITAWIKAAKFNEPIKIFGDKNKILSPLHVSNFNIIFTNLLDLYMDNKQTLKICSIAGKPQKAINIVDKIKKHFDSKSKVLFSDHEIAQPQGEMPSDYSIDDFDSILETLK